ncbi:hypothetical protein QBC47DRAFT_297379 [Echria macrotheca]|uniref:Uncharacterized protein n=1 Tax=Echria macrotheca TaxID=438768 RepID=A0AAJ0BGZ4_9PEZI|nr:hypothetical protein QBC47DRAFT_297379 [Echria macrotheca]
MDSGRYQRVRFLHITNPTAVDGKVRRQIRSHAARETHARSRRVLMMNHLGKDRDSTSPGSGVPAADIAPEPKENPLPSPLTHLSSDRKDPFSAFSRPLGPIEHYLLDHYVHVFIPTSARVCDAIKASPDGDYYARHMTVDWVPLALADEGLLSGILITACRDLSGCAFDPAQKRLFAMMAIRYKVICLKALNDALGVESTAVKDSSLAKVITLVTDEVRDHVLHPGFSTLLIISLPDCSRKPRGMPEPCARGNEDGRSAWGDSKPRTQRAFGIRSFETDT